MARANVIMQPPTRITLATGYTQPDKDALLVGDAKTIQLVVEIYENNLTANATLVFEANNDVDPTPMGYPSAMVGGWFTPDTTPGSIGITATATFGAQKLELTKFSGKIVRYRFSAGTGPLGFAIFASLYDV